MAEMPPWLFENRPLPSARPWTATEAQYERFKALMESALDDLILWAQEHGYSAS